MGAKDKLKELIPIIENKENYSDQEYLDAQFKFNNLLKTADNLAMTTKFMEDRNAGYVKARKTDGVWEELDYEKSFQDGYANTYFTYDEKGSILVATKDTNNDGVVGIGDEVLSLEELKNGVIDHDYSFQKKISLTEEATRLKALVGTFDNTTSSGTQDKDLKKEALDRTVDEALYDGSGKLTDYSKSQLRERGLMKSVKDEVDLNSEAIKKAMDNIKTELTNATSDQSDRLHKDAQVSRDNTTKPSEGGAALGEQVEADPNYWGGVTLDTDKYWAVDLKSGAKIASLKIGDKQYSNAEPRTATIDANGDLVLNIVYQNYKSSKYGTPRQTANKIAQLTALAAGLEKKTSLTTAQENKYKETKLELEAITTGMENEDAAVIVPREVQAKVAKQLGTTIEAIRARATKNAEVNMG